jgi:glycosyltransferase involved in cell wall biosynthesis
MKICMIGPTYPFRGGTAQHTTLLYRHLRRRHRVTFYGFKRQYPGWLYPGETDRDASESPLREPGVENVLDSLNPLTWWEAYKRIKQDGPELVIIPWWTTFWTPQFWTVATLVKRFCPAKILFICHNVEHETHALSQVCTRAVLSKGDHFFVHSEGDGERLKQLIPSSVITRVYTPLFDFFKTRQLSKAEARAKLGLQGDTILFFGYVRPYKGLDVLLKTMPLILERRKLTLLVVGEFWHGREACAQQIKELSLENAVRVIDRYVPNEEVEVYFSAADLVVLPYVSGKGSGLVQTAYGLEKPVIATRVGTFPEDVEDGRTGYLVNPNDPQALAGAVIRFFAERKEAEFVENIRRVKERFSWENLVALIDRLHLQDTAAAA